MKEGSEPLDWEYRFGKAQHAWNKCYRIAIPHLLKSEQEFDEFAMLGLLVCMEEVFRLKTYRKTGKLSSDSGKMLKMFFGEDIDSQSLNVVKRQFVNAIRHQSTLENWGTFNVEYEGREEVLQHWQVMHVTSGEKRASLIEVHPEVIWNRCAPQIDAFYNDYELDSDQIPESYGGVVEMWITTSLEELPANAKQEFRHLQDRST